MWAFSGEEWLQPRRSWGCLSNPFTGEVRYETDDGAPAQSFWAPPAEEIPDVGRHRVQHNDLRPPQSSQPSRSPPQHRYREEWDATVVLQRVARGAMARWRVARALAAVFPRELDESGFYRFQHPVSGEWSFHKPPGMRNADVWHRASPRPHDARLAAIFRRTPFESDAAGGGSCRGEGAACASAPGGWAATRESRKAQYGRWVDAKYRDGPFIRRQGPGARTERISANAFLQPKPFHPLRPLAHPATYDPTEVQLGDRVLVMDGRTEKSAPSDPYFMVLTHSQRGPASLAQLMDRYPGNVAVQALALRRMTSMPLPESPTGSADNGAVTFLRRALHLLQAMRSEPWVVQEACGVLASLTGLRANRYALYEEIGWLEEVVAAVMALDPPRLPASMADEAELSRDEIVALTRARTTAMYACYTFANVACDEEERDWVAGEAAAAAVYCLKIMPGDTLLAQSALCALYHMAHRNEAAHGTVLMAGGREIALKLLESTPKSDKHLVADVERLLLALEHDGWRAEPE